MDAVEWLARNHQWSFDEEPVGVGVHDNSFASQPVEYSASPPVGTETARAVEQPAPEQAVSDQVTGVPEQAVSAYTPDDPDRVVRDSLSPELASLIPTDWDRKPQELAHLISDTDWQSTWSIHHLQDDEQQLGNTINSLWVKAHHFHHTLQSSRELFVSQMINKAHLI